MPLMDDLEQLASAASSKPRHVPYQTPALRATRRGVSRMTRRMNAGFEFGLGFWASGVVVGIICAIGLFVLTWIGCASQKSSQPAAPVNPVWPSFRR